MIRRALENPYLGQPFKYLVYYHITHRKFFRATWSWKMSQKLTKNQKFRESQLAPKNKIWSFARFLKLSFTSTVHNVMIRCVLDSPGPRKPFKYLGHHHITHRKFFRATWSRGVSEKVDESQKFRESLLALKIQILYFPLFRSVASLVRIVWLWFDVHWKTLIWGNLLNILDVIISFIKNF